MKEFFEQVKLAKQREDEDTNNLLEQLKQARLAEQEALSYLEVRQRQLEETASYKLVQDAKLALVAARDKLGEVDSEVRQWALDFYELTGDKNPHDKVSIVINRTLHYQESEAFDWAGRNAPSMLMLNKKKFEKHARAVLETIPLAFVEVEEVPSVRIAGEL